MQQQVEVAARERRLREIGYEIRDAETNIRNLEVAMVRALAGLKDRKRIALSGTGWEASLSQGMDAIAHQYEAQIENEHAKIVRLEQESQRLTSPQKD